MDDLFAALVKFATVKSLRVELIFSDAGHISAQLKGAGVWQKLSPEIGTHCVQRVPPTENKGRRHTSYVSVALLPVIDHALPPLDKKDVEVTTQRGHGKGGQHQNMTDSAVRMRHLPTGLSVFINGRKQLANKAEALQILTARVHDFQRQKTDVAFRTLRKSQMGNAGRGKKIRTYNFSDGRAVDHRNGKRSNVKTVLRKGEFDDLR